MAKILSPANSLCWNLPSTLTRLYSHRRTKLGMHNEGISDMLNLVFHPFNLRKSNLRKFEIQNSSRPTLDDVDRLSRGRSSKAKIGSRKVPHRLTADERKGYDLARKRGFVVIPVRSRRYPLVNTYRNYCEAVIWPNIRIEQVDSQTQDTVVIDLTTLNLSPDSLLELKAKIDLTAKEISEGLKENPSQHAESSQNLISESDLSAANKTLDESSYKLNFTSVKNSLDLCSDSEKVNDEVSELDSASFLVEKLDLSTNSQDEILTFSFTKPVAKAFAKQVLKACLSKINSKKTLCLG